MADGAYDVIVIGGGFYGCRLGLLARSRFSRVLIVEREQQLMARASTMNQARVHRGYHYPRSYMTALRSAINSDRFASQFPECVDASGHMVYAIARNNSKVTPTHFEQMCARISAPVQPATPAIARLFDSTLVAQAFVVEEYLFNADLLRTRMAAELAAAGVEIMYGTTAGVISQKSGSLRVHVRGPAGEELALAGLFVLNCTYADTNKVLSKSSLPPLPLKYEMAEVSFVEVPEELRNLGVTIIDGPFFSLLPFPTRGLHSFTHVRYTPIQTWRDGEGIEVPDGQPSVAARGFPYAVRDAARYLPAISGARYVDSKHEIKVVLSQSEMDDGRPILISRSRAKPNLITVLGGKIDNVFDAEEAVRAIIDGE